jgi:hypothetical protein
MFMQHKHKPIGNLSALMRMKDLFGKAKKYSDCQNFCPFIWHSLAENHALGATAGLPSSAIFSGFRLPPE